MVICLERGADLHMAQLMPLPLTVSCFSKIQIGFTFLVPAHPDSPRQRAVKRCVCVSTDRKPSAQRQCSVAAVTRRAVVVVPSSHRRGGQSSTLLSSPPAVNLSSLATRRAEWTWRMTPTPDSTTASYVS